MRKILGRWLVLSFLLLTILPLPVAEARHAIASRATTDGDVTDAVKLVSEFEVNGLKVLLKRRTGSQTVVAGLFLRGGSRNITEKTAGVEALMLDVATEASANYPREKFRRETSSTGTLISSGINYDYSALTLGTTRRFFDRSWNLFVDAALHPSFALDDFQRVRNRMIVAVNDDEDTPDSFIQVLQSRVIYAGHPYLNDPRGTANSLKSLTIEDVKKFHQEMMQASRLLLVVVGDIDAQMLREKVEASFGKLPRGNYQAAPVPQLSFSEPTLAVTARDIPTNYVQGIFVAPTMTSPDISAMRIASSILQTRVFVEVRVRRNLSYAPDAFLGSQGANTGGISVSAVDANQATKVMLDEIARLQQQPISQDELKATVQQFLTRYYLGEETNAAQAGELAQYELIGGGWRNSFNVIDQLRSVTPEDVQRVSLKYMRNIQFIVLGNPSTIDRAIFVGGAATGKG
ncbi:MAG TPA: pitrilysin family protein [Pyrinomonadaceae bacterium]|jgi:predicted Zn-dependent peptidase